MGLRTHVGMGMLVRPSAIPGLFTTMQPITHMTIILAVSSVRSPQFSRACPEHALVAGVFAHRMDGHRPELKGQCLETAPGARVCVDIVTPGFLDVPAGFIEELRLGGGRPALVLAKASQARYLSQGDWREQIQMSGRFQRHPA